jgi:hypothetical protein
MRQGIKKCKSILKGKRGKNSCKNRLWKNRDFKRWSKQGCKEKKWMKKRKKTKIKRNKLC